MKNNGYEESEKGMPFRGEDRQGKALRLMEALSGVDEELLERAEGGEARNKSRWPLTRLLMPGLVCLFSLSSGNCSPCSLQYIPIQSIAYEGTR